MNGDKHLQEANFCPRVFELYLLCLSSEPPQVVSRIEKVPDWPRPLLIVSGSSLVKTANT